MGVLMFFIGAFSGAAFGVGFMCCLQINRCDEGTNLIDKS